MEMKAMQPAPLASTSIKLLIGLFVTALGVLLALDNLDLIHSDRYLEWWPAVIIGIGILKLAGGGSRFFGVVLILAGAWLLAYNLEVIRFTFFDLWPLILIGIGLGFVARAIGWKPDISSGLPSATTWGILSQRKIRVTSSNFSGARYVAFMGGCEIDLSAAEIVTSPAVIETFAVWGGIVIEVPEGWEIVGEVLPVMGGFEVMVRPAPSTGRQLIVRGAAVMGGVEIKSVPRRVS